MNQREDLSQESGFDARILSESPRFRRRRISHSSSDKTGRSKLPEEFQSTKVYQPSCDPALMLKKGAKERIGHARIDARNRPKLPDSFQAFQVYKNDSEVAAARKPMIAERIKKMVQEKEIIDDDEQHRRFVARLTSRIKKRIPQNEQQIVPDSDNKLGSLKNETKLAASHLMKKTLVESKGSHKQDGSEDEAQIAMEFDEPSIPTMRRRQLPPRSSLVAMFASDVPNPENETRNDKSNTVVVDHKNPVQPLPDIPSAEDVIDGKPSPNPAIMTSPRVETSPYSTVDTVHQQDPSMLSKIIAACVAMCLMSAIIYFALL